MLLKKLRTLALVGALSVVAATGAAGSMAIGDEGDSYVQVLGGVGSPKVSAAELEDLELVAASLGISFEEAKQRFAGQEEFAVAVDEIRALEPESFSTAEWGAGEGYAASIAFVSLPSAESISALEALPVKVKVSTNRLASEVDLIRAQIAARESVAKQPGVLAAESETDSSTGKITVTYELSLGARTIASDLAVDAAAAILGKGVAETTVDLVQGDVAEPNEAAIVGGNPIGGCTAAFTVTSSGVNGITTAGHCGNYTYSYGGTSAPFKREAHPSSGDVQWHSLSLAVTNKFRYTPAGGQRYVTGVANPTSGSAICYWGKTTGTNCGTVNAINYCDSDGYCMLFRYGPSTVDHGDSGGPWYYGNNAKGVTRGFMTNGLGFRVDDIATRVGAINLLSLAVKTTP